MIVMFSARRLKPGAWEQFRRAWDSGGERPPGFQRAHHARNIRDDDEVISFGVFDMSEDEYRQGREASDAQRTNASTRCRHSPRNDHVSGVYEVLEVLD